MDAQSCSLPWRRQGRCLYALIQRGRRLRTENEGVLPAFDSMDWTGPNPFFPPALKSLLVDSLHAGPIFKHESFASEAEWRLSNTHPADGAAATTPLRNDDASVCRGRLD